jgi:predicted phosphodiesterase
MKLGIISDIHADPKALRRALEDMPSIDALLCPGDAVSEYRFCTETVEILQQANVLCIQGNHEVVLFGGRNPAYLKKCKETFPAEALEFLATAPLTRDLTFNDTKVLLAHESVGTIRRIHLSWQYAARSVCHVDAGFRVLRSHACAVCPPRRHGHGCKSWISVTATGPRPSWSVCHH